MSCRAHIRINPEKSSSKNIVVSTWTTTCPTEPTYAQLGRHIPNWATVSPGSCHIPNHYNWATPLNIMHAPERFLHGIAITRSHINSFSRCHRSSRHCYTVFPWHILLLPSSFKIIKLKTLSNVHTTVTGVSHKFWGHWHRGWCVRLVI
jgi:hypothetical protein